MPERLRHPLLSIALAALSLAVALAIFSSVDSARATTIEPCVENCEDPPPPPPPHPSILVLNVGWGGPDGINAVEPSVGRFLTEYLGGHVNDWFSMQAPGIFRRWNVVGGGSYEIAPPIAVAPLCQEYNKFEAEITSRAEAKAREAGINPDAYDVVVFHWSQPFCGIGGRANGRHILLPFIEAATHELGHYLGLGHANVLQCVDLVTGAPVPLNNNCKETEYGDPYDTMGGGTSDGMAFSAPRAYQLGWLNGQFAEFSTNQPSAVWNLYALSGPTRIQRALRVADGATTLWLEYRTEVGVESELFRGKRFWGDKGLVIHRVLPGAGTTQLIDMTPGSPERFADAPLRVGQTWANPLGTAKITLLGQNAEYAQVRIETEMSTVPNLDGKTTTQARSTLQAAHLQLGAVRTEPDPSCLHINRVDFQTPAAGTVVRWGTSVAVTIGVEDQQQRCF